MINSVVIASTPDIKASIDFYEKLKFTRYDIEEEIYFSDGSTLIELRSERTARTGLKFYRDSWVNEVEKLNLFTAVQMHQGDYFLNDHSGVRIQLVESNSPLSIELNEEDQSVLGKPVGISLEGISIAQMYKIYKVLGFKKTMGEESGSWLTTMNDDGFTISMMGLGSCPHMFYNPSLTFFNGTNNLNVISDIRSAGIKITEEVTVFNKEGLVDNVVVRDPGGLGFFIFSD